MPDSILALLLAMLFSVLIAMASAVYLWSANRERRNRAWRLLMLLVGQI